tara:strand:+ start:1609 stop:1740 length:132 start_codon:yes stop_codon:yes gene_type:complete
MEYLNEKYYLVNERGNIIYTQSEGKPVYIPKEYRKYYASYKKR